MGWGVGLQGPGLSGRERERYIYIEIERDRERQRYRNLASETALPERERERDRETERERERERERARARERERERERDRENAATEVSYRRGGGLLPGRGSYRKKNGGIIFGGSTKKSVIAPGQLPKKLVTESFW